MELLKVLNERYATKKMNGATVPQEKVEAIVEAARLAPTSSGLQPFKVIVITNKELKEKIVPIAFNQSQVADCSHLLVFAAWDNYTNERITQILDYTVAERGLPTGTMDEYKNRLLSIYGNRDAELNFIHAAHQSYIAFGLAIAAAGELKVDATPMEGFDAEALDKLLGLREQGLRSVTMSPLGYRDEANDWLVNLKKVRRPKEEFVSEIK